MDKTAAAGCAMRWSIELEKGLRSKKPGHPIESIHQIASRLKQWSEEPQLTSPFCNMFGLVPGEDRLFADAILLRLADAFVSGDKATRTAVLKVFLSTLRPCKTKDQANGIFSNMSTENRLELLRRVKVVLHAECVESRALTLILFGCWADIAKDIAEIRHAILSNLVSSNVLEGGAELVRKSFEEDVLVAMLISLTKLSCRTGTLILDQVGLLSSFLAQNTSLRMQATIWRCLHYIGDRAAWLLPSSSFPGQTLLRVFDEPNVPSPMRHDILQVLLKMIAYGVSGMPLTDVNNLMKLLRFVEDASQSSCLSEKLLAFEVLVCVSSKLKGTSDVTFEDNLDTFLSGVVSALSDQITPLMSLVLGGTVSLDIQQELRSMLRLLLMLVENHSEMGYFILDKLRFTVENRLNLHMPTAATQSSAVQSVVNSGDQENKILLRMFMFYIYRFLVAFLEILNEAGAATDQVLCKLKHLVSFVCGSSYFDCSTHTFYALLLHSHVNWDRLQSENKNPTDSAQGMGKSPFMLMGCEIFIDKCAGNMLAGAENWYAYRAAKYAACEGVWYVANFIYQQLETRVQSYFCCQWLKFLVHFTSSEMNLQVLFQQACHSSPPNDVPYVVDNGGRDIISSGYIEKVVDACSGISLSDKVLEAISLRTQTLYFQRWFLTLRVKILLVLVDVLKFLDTCLSYKDMMGNIEQAWESDATGGNLQFQKIESLKCCLFGMSSRLSNIAEECDLVASSFMDMDSKSLKLISTLAFSCSLFAFCTGFSTLFPDSPASKNSTANSGDCYDVLVQDLAGRLWHTDHETCVNLMLFLKEHAAHENSLHLLPRFQISKVGWISEDVLTICRFSVREVIGLRKKCSSVHNKDAILQASSDGVQLLLSIIAKWMRIPFRIPHYFFRLRPIIGSVLIYSSAGCGKQNEISVSPGSHLALSLCIQLKNMSVDICSKVSKIYCILQCKKTYLVTRPSGEMQMGFQASKTDMMIDLNKKLQHYVMKQTRQSTNWKDHSDDEVVEVFICFKTNGSAQGMSTCLLDVSSFPVGSYRIHWHSGCVDSQGAYWSILPLSPGPVFSVENKSSQR